MGQRTKGAKSQWQYDNLLADLKIVELELLEEKKKIDLQDYREKYSKKYHIQINGEKDFWELPLEYDEQEIIFRNYKNMQQQYKMIKEELENRQAEEYSLSFERGRMEKTVTNWNLDNQDYRGAYNQSYTRTRCYKLEREAGYEE